jgi:hypothetical protein
VDAKAQFRSPAEPWADNGTGTGAQTAEARRATGGGCHACRTRVQLPRGQEYDFKGWVGFRMSDDPKENEEAPRPSVEHIQEPERKPGNVGLFHRPF